MIPFFLPVWRSALLRDAILGILLAAAALHAVELGIADSAKSEPGVSRAYDPPDRATKDPARPAPFFSDSNPSQKK